MALWRGGETCLVSVVCCTFNHERFIRQALDSFLGQVTQFPFQIIVHDDASTDGTPEVIRQYAAAYPNLVKPIFQVENQYSKGGFKPSIYAAGHSPARYIALCEGDDFWLDCSKLQIQIDALEKNPGSDFSFHPAFL